MEPSPVDVLGGFHYFVVRLLEIVSEPGGTRDIIYNKTDKTIRYPLAPD